MPPAPDCQNTLSRVRIDPLAGVYNLRGYSEPGNPDTPLSDEQRGYQIVGTVTISGESATVSATLGDMKDAKMRMDFDRRLMAEGVKKIHWERHENGYTEYYTRELRG